MKKKSITINKYLSQVTEIYKNIGALLHDIIFENIFFFHSPDNVLKVNLSGML